MKYSWWGLHEYNSTSKYILKYLLLCDVDGLVEHHPSDCFVAGWCRCWSIVGHVVIRIGKQSPNRESFDERLIPTVANALQLIGEHAQLRIREVSKL